MKRMMRVLGIGAAALAILAMGSMSARAEEGDDDKADEGKSKVVGNRKCPMSGKDVAEGKSIKYADDEAKVYGVINFCCGNCQKGAEGKDAAGKKELYAKAYLASRKEGGKGMEYGKTRLEVKNAKCPVGGHDAKADSTINYNAMSIQLCCKDCVKGFQDDPAKALGAIQDDIKAARKAKGGARKAGK